MSNEDTSDVTARATAARERIMAEVSAGRFQLTHEAGYLMGDTGPEGRRCVGCALGALAFTFCGMKDFPDHGGTQFMQREAVRAGGVTLDDCRQLEMGFEGWSRVGTDQQDKVALADPAHPFHQLGVELAAVGQAFDEAEMGAEWHGESEGEGGAK